jgi:hypothetical protein
MPEQLSDNHIDGLSPDAANTVVGLAYQNNQLLDDMRRDNPAAVQEGYKAGLERNEGLINALGAGQGPAPANSTPNSIPGYSPDAANLFVDQAGDENELRDAAKTTDNPTVLEGLNAGIARKEQIIAAIPRDSEIGQLAVGGNQAASGTEAPLPAPAPSEIPAPTTQPR